ncbi:hypothetical protein CKO11_09865 [Rhodobacter sp. TJ_12]|uniref:hypothetical protein n=1 Tax=Rhodobacter sp. TJ_12 TaxID=2029399 RepID=UPI001CBF68CF|nr:hypothetical protein [Rhodobacter sp. TJ_12]MBZ4022764.1 hypothetical protein [Rhodobacter sp. TJ_12]
MKRLFTFTATLALVAGSLPAVAQTAPTTVVPGQQFMQMWDLDSDGKVTRAEAREHRDDLFYMFDSDENGSFSPDELRAIDDFKLAQLDAGMGPGHQRPDGMQPGQGRRAQQGMAQGQQMQPRRGMGQGQPGMQPQGRGMGPGKGQGMMAQQGQGMRGQGMQGQGMRAQAMQGQGMQGQGMRGQGMNGQGMGMGPGAGMQGSGFFASAQDEMMRFDRNRDAKVTRLEFVEGTDSWFAMRDTNRDGVLTPEDFGPRR